MRRLTEKQLRKIGQHQVDTPGRVFYVLPRLQERDVVALDTRGREVLKARDLLVDRLEDQREVEPRLRVAVGGLSGRAWRVSLGDGLGQGVDLGRGETDRGKVPLGLVQGLQRGQEAPLVEA